MKPSRVAAASVPLLATGTCLAIAERSLVSGFFDALTPFLLARAEEAIAAAQSGVGAGADAARR